MLRELAANVAAIVNILALLFGWAAMGQDAGFDQKRVQEPGGVLERDAFVRQNLGDRAQQGISVARSER